jgi:hypothetical protein
MEVGHYRYPVWIGSSNFDGNRLESCTGVVLVHQTPTPGLRASACRLVVALSAAPRNISDRVL